MDAASYFNIFIILVQVLAFSSTVLLVIGRDIPPFLVRLNAAWAIALYTSMLAVFFAILGFDYRIFWRFGAATWAGQDIYSASSALEPVYPPTALPLFAAVAALPFRASFALFTAFNIAACVALPAYARRVLAAQGAAFDRLGGDGSAAGSLSTPALAMLSVALAASESSLVGILSVGQLSVLAAVLLVAALDAQARRRPVVAGVLLAIATVKPTAMLPFLLLFLRRGDVRSWVALAATCLVMLAATGHLASLRDDLAVLSARVAKYAAPGQVNDYTFGGTQSHTIIAFNHALYRVGLWDRDTIRIGQAAALLATGLWVGWLVAFARIPRAAACSLVALYSMTFLYHRAYDATALALPLTYLTGRATSTPGRARWAFALGAISVLFVLYLKPDSLRYLMHRSFDWGAWGRLIQAAVLPYGLWLTLLAMGLLVYGEAIGRAKANPLEITGPG